MRARIPVLVKCRQYIYVDVDSQIETSVEVDDLVEAQFNSSGWDKQVMHFDTDWDAIKREGIFYSD